MPADVVYTTSADTNYFTRPVWYVLRYILSITTRNSSIYTASFNVNRKIPLDHMYCGRCLYACSREQYKRMRACTGRVYHMFLVSKQCGLIIVNFMDSGIVHVTSLNMTVRVINTWSGVLDLWSFVFVNSLKMALRCQNMLEWYLSWILLYGLYFNVFY
jgi:hypothetical protein